MDISIKQEKWRQERPLFEAEFIHSHLLPYFNFNESTGDYEIKSEFAEDEDFEKAWQENRHIWESTKNLAKAMFYAGQAKAQAVPEVINVGNELQSWVAVWSFKARHDHEDYIVVDANLLADKIEKLTGANA